ncbi:E3 ubiquitin-protein ligase NEURL3 [Sorex araneus]|uniref:E3 ubiquitin-protein ligase NEURL3 n=1 Tax=Sorex araneus TaxID=42254 RepID=UPI002433BA02|nr:E3 ubiquitin-protein ligase NEURL3 [Sorex araneus]
MLWAPPAGAEIQRPEIQIQRLKSPAAGDADFGALPETLCFHAEAKGAQVLLDERRRVAGRRATFHDGIVFSQRPVQPRERVALRVLRNEGRWQGGLRVGFTRLDPARVSASCLPPFVCPDLEQQSPTWAAQLPELCVLAGSVVSFWVNQRGWLFAEVNAGPPLLLRKDLRMGAPLWAVMDVYGTTKAIELLDSTANIIPTPRPQLADGDSPQAPEDAEDCTICFHHTADTFLVPCGHPHFCSHCAWRVFRETATCPLCRSEIQEVGSLCLLQGLRDAPESMQVKDWT